MVGSALRYEMKLTGLLRRHKGMERILGPLLSNAFRTGMLNAAQKLRDEIRSAAPKHWWGTRKRATGRASGTMSFYVDDSEWPKGHKSGTAMITLMTNWAQYVYTEFGRGPVFPKRKPLLYIPLKQRASMNPFTGSYSTPLKNLKFGTDYVWSKGVGPAKAQRYADKSWNRLRPQLRTLINRPVKEAIRRAASS